MENIMLNKKYSKFICAVKSIFAYLENKGFIINEDSVVKEQLYCAIEFIGKKVSICFSYDTRGDYCECLIGVMINGKMCRNTKEGYKIDLETFLLKKYFYRGIDRSKLDIVFDDFPELHKYDLILKTIGSEVLEDNKNILLDYAMELNN